MSKNWNELKKENERITNSISKDLDEISICLDQIISSNKELSNQINKTIEEED